MDEIEKLLLTLTSSKRRGRKPVAIGDSRDFIVQGNNEDVYIRLPVHTLGLKKGDRTTSFFQDGQIVVSKT